MQPIPKPPPPEVYTPKRRTLTSDRGSIMKRSSSMILGLCIAMSSYVSVAQPQQPQTRTQQISLDISARPIADALNEFAHQAGLQVVFYTSIGQGLRSRNLTGTYTADEALQRLLADTALQYKFINEHTVAIR